MRLGQCLRAGVLALTVRLFEDGRAKANTARLSWVASDECASRTVPPAALEPQRLDLEFAA